MLKLFQVDAFTDKPFKGNPAAVCLLEDELDEELYLKISSEMNLSETAFIYPLDKQDWSEAKRFSLRWFTPKIEVPLCGHATLATASVLFIELNNFNSNLEFETKSGILKARLDNGLIKLDFPIEEPTSFQLDNDMKDIIGFSKLVNSAYSQVAQKLLIHIENELELKSLQPNFQKLLSKNLEINPIGIIITSETAGEFDFISRFFAPWVGVNEDPVTGSAHTVLYPYWKKALHKDTLVAYQASHRGGVLYLSSIDSDRVEIGGNAVTVFRGDLDL